MHPMKTEASAPLVIAGTMQDDPFAITEETTTTADPTAVLEKKRDFEPSASASSPVGTPKRKKRQGQARTRRL